MTILPIIGYSISSITAERKRLPAKRIDIRSTPRIISVDKRSIKFAGKRSALAVGFEFITTYRPDIGKIRIVGEILYANKDWKKILGHWLKKRKLPEKADMEIRNFLFRKCLTLGITLSENLQLPPPIMFPVIVPKKDEERTRYIG